MPKSTKDTTAGAKTNSVVVASDLHCGSLLGLFPPHGFIRSDKAGTGAGSRVIPSDFQRWLWRCWEEFWYVFVPEATEGEPYDVVLNGDIVEGRHHGQDVLVSNNVAEQMQIAVECLRLVLERNRKLRRVFVLAGTEAHCGLSNETTEMLAERLPHVVPDVHGNILRPELWIEIGMRGRHNALCHIAHHIGTTSVAAYETTAIHRELVEAFQEAARWRNRPPDVIIRSHRHRAAKTSIQTGNGYCIAEVTAGWQGKTPYAYRIAGARQAIPQFGGLVIRSGVHDTYTRSAVWGFKRTQVV